MYTSLTSYTRSVWDSFDLEIPVGTAEPSKKSHVRHHKTVGQFRFLGCAHHVVSPDPSTLKTVDRRWRGSMEESLDCEREREGETDVGVSSMIG